MSENNVGTNRGFKFHLLEFLASVLLIALLGFPFWLPLILMLQDLNMSSNPLILLISGERHDYQAAFFRAIQYFVQFIPAIILYYWYKTTKTEEPLELINASVLSANEYKGSEALSWKKIGITGNPTSNEVWMSIKPNIMAFKNTYKYQIFTYPAMFAGLLYSFVKMIDEGSVIAFILNYGFLGMVIALLLNVLFYHMSFSGFLLDTKRNKLQVGVDLISLSEVHYIQVIRKQHAHTTGGGELFNVYEANVIYSNNKRYNFLNHGGLSDLFKQIEQVNEYFQVDVLVDAATIKEISAHNKAVSLQKS